MSITVFTLLELPWKGSPDMDTSQHPLLQILSLPEAEQREFKAALSELLDRGSLLGFETRSRDLYRRAAGPFFGGLRSVLSLLDMELVNDDERLLLQARPTDACALQRRFDQTESLFVLALWKVYDEHRQAGKGGAVILSLDDFFAKLKSYLPNLLQAAPKVGTYNRVLSVLQRRNLVRFSWNESSPGLTELQVLPTILYVMPFARLEAWAVQMEKFATLGNGSETTTSDDAQQS
jgi:hypothetical protein